jgi:hypothetical protein
MVKSREFIILVKAFPFSPENEIIPFVSPNRISNRIIIPLVLRGVLL